MSPTEKAKKRVEAATVRVNLPTDERGQGQGVYVGEHYILSAAHCFEYDTTGGIILGDYVIFDVQTPDGKQLKVSPVFLDPCSDLALLGPCDSQEFSEWEEDFCEWCDAVEPVPIRSRALDFDVPGTHTTKRGTKRGITKRGHTKRGQNYFSVFLGRPRGRIVRSRSSDLANRSTHLGSP